MKRLPNIETIGTTEDYDELLKALYAGVKRNVEEIEIPPVPVISVEGNEPPGSRQYGDAISVLYGTAYGIKMGLKFGKVPRPEGYFDYKVGALETFWWSTGTELEIRNSETLRWQAYLMVPAFVTGDLLEIARKAAKEKHPDIPYEIAGLATVAEWRSVQILHVGPYDMEQPTIDALHAYIAEHGLLVNGRHHEIYISDPRRTKPEKLKTVIRYAVRSARG